MISFEHLLHLDQYIEPLILEWGYAVYGLVAIVIFLESACILTPILPGDGLLFLLGFVAAKHMLDINWVMTVIFSTTVIGYSINFYLGLKVGHYIRPKLNHRYQQYILQAEQYYQQYDIKAIIMARFIPIIRTFVPFVTGLLQINAWRFFWVNLMGASLWVFILVGSGWLAGGLNLMQSSINGLVVCIMILSMTPLLYQGLKYIWGKYV